VAVELQGQLLAWERELDSNEGAITTWKVGLVALSTPLERLSWSVTLVMSELRLSSRTSSPRCASLVPGQRAVEECQILLCLQEMYLLV
jgi:hypothetical protein